ncbi:hypothetical protein [Mycolicibacterium hodleri]|uniref:Uncharacterized protein n=1 Tax=Mycolicibacterium hodleri TaxID=49897 RepID=A0A502EA33_9MYCO|nr:hypothetical protein [Mycolicibacterium hodleri]TPG34578.1 hypothetical protein EAH80_13740 [Mycolicibacterium hodleri]
MTLTDPSQALAEQSSFVGYLVGLAGLAKVVQALAENGEQGQTRCAADDLVFALLGLAGLGEAIERLAEPAPAQHFGEAATPPAASMSSRWLR